MPLGSVAAPVRGQITLACATVGKAVNNTSTSAGRGGRGLYLPPQGQPGWVLPRGCPGLGRNSRQDTGLGKGTQEPVPSTR